MSFVSVFNSQLIRPWNQPQPDTFGQVDFPRPFPLPPRLPQGINALDIAREQEVRVMSLIEDVTRSSAVYHLTALGVSTLYAGMVHSLDISPFQVQFKNGEWTRDLTADPNAPASMRINFSGAPFAYPPKVVVFLNRLEFDNKHDWRIQTTVTNIDQTGFTLTIDKWGDTQLYAATAGWVAYPANQTGIFSMRANTMNVRPWDQPQLLNSQAITFGNATFKKTPEVFVALNSLDIGYTGDLRINATVDNVSREGLTWHIDGWGDTVLYYAEASIIAIDALD